MPDEACDAVRSTGAGADAMRFAALLSNLDVDSSGWRTREAAPAPVGSWLRGHRRHGNVDVSNKRWDERIKRKRKKKKNHHELDYY